MACKLFLLLVLPAFVYGNIHINIQASTRRDRSFVNFVGTDVAVISEAEQQTFRLHDEGLKGAVGEYHGRRPNDAYVRSPTRWNLYNRFGWREVHRVLKPISARVLSVTTEPVIVSRQELRNNSPVKGTFNAGMSQSVETTATTSWSTGGELSIDQEITVGISIEVAHVSSTTRMSYSTSWGRNTEQSKAITVGTSSGVEVELQPGEVVHAELTATRGTMEVEVDYEAHLEGKVAVNYGRRHQGHHFYGLDVSSVMEAAGLPRTVNSKAIVKIGFYSDAKVEIRGPIFETSDKVSCARFIKNN